MNIRINETELETIRNAQDAIILGIIKADGKVQLAVANKETRAGHRDWIRQASIKNVAGGFSLLVRNGKVRGFFALSTLNTGPTGRLPPELVRDIQALLPCDNSAIIYGE